ncbi:glycosyltransferase family 17 protein [Piromyces sp. E2]|nr:glycosyltransferase family 17 protein [Piromyces sp. E2]|eukprot:OUM61812.1 glycosyltransferase family 17 protein [Piromyces sp. E2]
MENSSELEGSYNLKVESEINNDYEDNNNSINESKVSLLNDSEISEDNETCVLINSENSNNKLKKKKKKTISSYYIPRLFYHCKEPVITDEKYSKIKGEPFIDKFGIDLNQFMETKMISQKIPKNDTLDNWELYTPICPHLEPVHYSEEILNPNCEELSLQFVNFNIENEDKIPYSLHLHNITSQIKKFNEWNKNTDKKIPDYRNEDINSLLSDKYHPFDYGYYEEKETELKTEEDIVEFYRKVTHSCMDEVPDPRHRRFFSFILFNSEFDFLDLFLATYYEVIDYFVIYEANVTFSGNPKPLFLTRMLTETNRYDKFKDKIIVFPMTIDNVCATKPFTKEGNARSKVVEMGLRAVNARHGDIFMHGDLDELPKPHIVSRLKKCGGWEHLQAGIGGGPKSTREKKVESYLQDNELYEQMPKDVYDLPDLEYERDTKVATRTTPNFAIFDAKRALGQYPEEYRNIRNKKEEKSKRINKKKRDEPYVDPLSQHNFDPYAGYTNKGYRGDKMRAITFQNVKKFNNKTDVVIWSGGWHMSSFLPTIEHFLNKIMSYSHFDRFYFMSEEKRREDMINHINKGTVYQDVAYYDFPIAYPKSPEKEYKYDFTYKTWLSYNDDHEKFKDAEFIFDHEIPQVVLDNPICYSYMIDRSFGLTKKLWWQVIPKDQWETVDFEKLDKKTLEEITPADIPEVLKPKALRNEN